MGEKELVSRNESRSVKHVTPIDAQPSPPEIPLSFEAALVPIV